MHWPMSLRLTILDRRRSLQAGWSRYRKNDVRFCNFRIISVFVGKRLKIVVKQPLQNHGGINNKIQ